MFVFIVYGGVGRGEYGGVAISGELGYGYQCFCKLVVREFIHCFCGPFDIVPLEFIGGHRIHGTMVTYGDRDGFGGGFFFVFVAGFAEVARGA